MPLLGGVFYGGPAAVQAPNDMYGCFIDKPDSTLFTRLSIAVRGDEFYPSEYLVRSFRVGDFRFVALSAALQVPAGEEVHFAVGEGAHPGVFSAEVIDDLPQTSRGYRFGVAIFREIGLEKPFRSPPVVTRVRRLQSLNLNIAFQPNECSAVFKA